MSRTALITGASSGLGAEFARQLAATGADLVLVARDRTALDDLADTIRRTHGVGVEVLRADLLKPRHLAQVVERLSDHERPIDLLVNNAGFGLPLDFASNDIDDEVRHLHLHVEVPMRLSHAALRAMLPRRRGRIINIASVGAFIPRSTYGACKRWLVEFSEWANVHYGPQGVTMTAVCPGYTHTNFHERLGLAPGEEGVPGWMWLDARKVVAEALRDTARGKALSVPALRYRLLIGLARFAPGSVGARIGARGR